MRHGRTTQKPPYVGALLRLGFMEVRRRLLKALVQHGYKDVSATHLVAFSYPFPDGVKPSELAARSNQSKQSINHMLAELEGSGFVLRKSDRNGRRRRVYLTARGRKVVAVCQQEMLTLQSEWSAQTGRKHFEIFLKVLRHMPASRPDKL